MKEKKSIGKVAYIVMVVLYAIGVPIFLSVVYTKRVLYNDKTDIWSGFVNNIDWRVSLMWFPLFAVIAIIAVWRRYYYINNDSDRGTDTRLTIGEQLFCLGMFIYFIFWATEKCFNYGPDEHMRYAVSSFLMYNNRLPVGAEALDPNWGFSYAHTPTVLSNWISYIPMKLNQLISDNEYTNVVAARMSSVLCGTGVVYFVIKQAKLLFKSGFKWMYICFVTFLPQFAFLCSYLNNDIVAMLGIAIIIYEWIYVVKYDWTYGRAIGLGIGISICALSYLNTFGWIVCSIPFAVITFLRSHKGDYKLLVKYIVIVVGVTVLLCAYTYIRQVVVYGDLLGESTCSKFGEQYAIAKLKPSARVTPRGNGESLVKMLKEDGWIIQTSRTLFLAFGYVQYFADFWVYSFFWRLFALGVMLFVVWLVVHIKNQYNVMCFSMMGAAIITVILAVWYSYNSDFNPQGRYIISVIYPLAIFAVKGYERLLYCIVELFKKLKDKKCLQTAKYSIQETDKKNELKKKIIFQNVCAYVIAIAYVSVSYSQYLHVYIRN